MIEKYVEAINAGKILSVDWRSIEDMLGENIERLHTCAIYTDDGSFPPKNETYSNQFTEEQICEILKQADTQFMAETYKDGVPYLPIEHRYFSALKPTSGPWIQNPNCKS